jgi:hypothetical protein
MSIAKKVLDLNPGVIKNLPQYYLGSLAPDAVHFRADFDPTDKKVSYLCVGDERWGEISNNDAWAENIKEFLAKYAETENMDFIYGFCVHCLSDLRNNIDIWSPFKLKYYGSLLMSDYGSGYDGDGIKKFHEDDLDADLRLYFDSDFRDEIWEHLSKAKGVTVAGVVSEDELNAIRDHILYKQYKDRRRDASFTGSFITYPDYLSFIEKAAGYISDTLFRVGERSEG